MTDESCLVVGLGNPGEQYVFTRHNIGFSALDYFCQQHDLSFTESKWQARFVSTHLWHLRLFLLKPMTYMNLSGSAVAPFIDCYQLQPEKVIVIHDDIDLRLGRIKIVSGGSSGGHKGIQSVIDYLGTENFPRLKIGVGRPGVPQPIDQYVLSRFAPEEQLIIEKNMPVVEGSIHLFCKKGISQAMNFANSKK